MQHLIKPKQIHSTLSWLTVLLFSLSIALFATPAYAAQTDITGPTGSGQFGEKVTVLPNGNFVVVDTGYDEGGVSDIGAVYLYNGANLSLISTLKGSTTSDFVGRGDITVLSNGNYVVRSLFWDNGAATNVGAVTWCSGTSGCTGVVSASNSLVGSTTSDSVGFGGITVLSNDNYVVRSPFWDNGAVQSVGAVTWCSGTSGCSGAVSASNSLVGSTIGDIVGFGDITILSNGNYVVRSSVWHIGAATDAGAVTWCSGTSGCSGVVSASNSLVGSTTSDRVGDITVLSNGNYVVDSPDWDNGTATDAGAVTWCSGTSGCAGVISASNSLVGSTTSDRVGRGGITALSNGNYVVRSPFWDNGAVENAGAVTWCSGTSGCSGVISASNSLVGSTTTTSDSVGADGITALSNGNYVVRSSSWDNGAVQNVGAVTWCSGTSGCTGVVSASNSLVGSTAHDLVGAGDITVLSNGHYVVDSLSWDNGAVENVGAVTWCSGTSGCAGAISASNSLVGSTASDDVRLVDITALSNGNYVVYSPDWVNGSVGGVTWCSGTSGCTGVVSASNSLVGSTIGDIVGAGGITALSNGNYVVDSFYWDNGAVENAGAVTWCSGTSGCAGVVSASNSLVGSTTSDFVGRGGITVLSNGNYVVDSSHWDNGTATDAGAVTWCSGTSGCTGVVSASNSLVGSTIGHSVGAGGITVLSNGNYVVDSFQWDNGAAIDVGAVTWCSGTSGCSGVVSASNSLVGSNPSDRVGGITALSNGNYVVYSSWWDSGAVESAGAVSYGDGVLGTSGTISTSNSVLGTVSNGISNFAFDAINDQLLVGRAASNIVSIFSPAAEIDLYYRSFLPLVVKGAASP